MSASKVRKAFVNEVRALVAGGEPGMLVTGTLFSATPTPVVFRPLVYQGLVNSKPRYRSADLPTQELLWTDYDTWRLTDDTGIGSAWESTDPVATPDLVTTWVAQDNATGVPVVAMGETPLSLPVAWPNKKFVPPGNSPWLGFHWVPASRDAATLGSGGEDELLGFVQIDVNVPQDSGEAVTESIMLAFENHFIAGHAVINDSQAATVVSCSRSSGRTVDPYWRTSLTINFYSRITRPPVNV